MSPSDRDNRAANVLPGAEGVYRQSVAGCLKGALGARGLDEAALGRWLDKLKTPLDALRDDYRTGRLPLLRIPEETADIEEGAAALDRLAKDAHTIVFFGTGGSGLGGQTLAQLAGWNISGGACVYDRTRPRTRFFDNLDAGTLDGALGGLDLARTRFIAISKSGGTTETLVQTIAAVTAVENAGLADRIPELFLGVTEPAVAGKPNGLRALLWSLGIPMLEHHPGIGGRFSCLTNVGLLPAIARGLDPWKIRQGARDVVEALVSAEHPRDFAPAVGAATAIALAKEKGARTLVMMPYADRLARFADWFVQLWAESLGKGGEGTVPIPAIGPVDQHSQLQLFMDGPPEFYITVIRAKSAGSGAVVDPAMARTAGAPFLAGKSVGDVIDAQAHAIAEALGRAGRPVRTIDLDRLDERTIGALLMHFMIETILAGRLLGIDPFDQPAVELAKELTRARLSD